MPLGTAKKYNHLNRILFDKEDLINIIEDLVCRRNLKVQRDEANIYYYFRNQHEENALILQTRETTNSDDKKGKDGS